MQRPRVSPYNQTHRVILLLLLQGELARLLESVEQASASALPNVSSVLVAEFAQLHSGTLSNNSRAPRVLRGERAAKRGSFSFQEWFLKCAFSTRVIKCADSRNDRKSAAYGSVSLSLKFGASVGRFAD